MSEQKGTEILQGGPFSLREVSNKEYQEFFESIIEQNALSEEQRAAIGDSIKTSIEKRDAMGAFLARLEGEAEILKKEEKRLAERRRMFEKVKSIMEESLHWQLENWGVKRVEGQKFTFSIKKNPASVEIVDESTIPAEFIDYEAVISKARIKDALSEGKEVTGAKLTQKTRLEIK